MGNYSSYRQVGPDVVTFTLGDGRPITGQFTQQFGRWLDGLLLEINKGVVASESTSTTIFASYSTSGGGSSSAATFASYSTPQRQTIRASYGSDRVRPVTARYSGHKHHTTFARYT